MARRSSRPKRDRQASNPSRKRVLALIGLGFFALVDTALIAVALSGGFEPAESDLAGTTPSTPAVVTPSATPEPTQTPQTPQATPVLRVLSAVDESVAWRAERGSCDAPAIIEVTEDAGATWHQTEPTTAQGHEVFWLWAQDDEYALAAVTTGDACELDGLRTFTGGNFWQTFPDAAADATFIDRVGALVTPSASTAPCEIPVDAAELGDATAVLCADGTVRSSADGIEWFEASVPGAIAIADAQGGYAIAVQASPSCEGVGVVYLSVEALTNGGNAGEPISCLTGAVDPALTELDVSDSSIWLWSGTEVGIAPAETLIS